VKSTRTSSPVSLRPVFVVGAPFSGVNLLAWSLGQHPHLSGRLEDGHTDDLLSAVETVHRVLSSSLWEGVIVPVSTALGETAPGDLDRDAFLATLAQAVAGSMSVAGRPLLASPALSDHVLVLSRLFPQGNFVHVVRDVDSAVAAAVAAAQDGDSPDARAASRNWLRKARRCIEAERILGSAVVSRVYRADLVDDPRGAVRRILRRIGERYVEQCLWPLALLQGVSAPSALTAARRRSIDPTARAFSQHLAGIRSRAYQRSPAGQRRAVSVALRENATKSIVTRRQPLHSRVRQAVCALPAASIVVVVSKGDEDLVSFPDRQGWHFPRTPAGEYAGHHPADSNEAIRRLRNLRQKGADYFVVPKPSMWWLDYYQGFRDHLNRYAIVHRDDDCLIFSLRKQAPRTRPAEGGRDTKVSDSSSMAVPRDDIEPTEQPMNEAFAITDRTPPLVLHQPLPGTLWAITAYYNPARYRNKSVNYRRFRDGLRAAGVPLLTVEVAFEDQRFELHRTDADMIVQLRGRDVLWQKERILNLGFRQLPDECDKVAWLDADILIPNRDWASQTAKLLNDYQVVQPFSHCVRLPPGRSTCDPGSLAFGDGENRLFYGLAFGVYARGYRSLSNHFQHGHPGYAWAARRGLLEKHGLFDGNLLGNGDTDIGQAMFGNFDYWSLRKLGPLVQAKLKQWADAFADDVRGSVSFVPGLLVHLWHGPLKDRLYHQLLSVLADFDPERDVMADPETGLYEWADASTELREWSRGYFAARNEDDPTQVRHP
jgi:hypothetical protein